MVALSLWKPLGCLGCLGRLLLFLILFFIFLFLLSQFRSCSSESGRGGDAPGEDVVVEQPAEGRMPPINDEDIIEEDGRQVVSNRLNVLFRPKSAKAISTVGANDSKSCIPAMNIRYCFVI